MAPDEAPGIVRDAQQRQAHQRRLGQRSKPRARSASRKRRQPSLLLGRRQPAPVLLVPGQRTPGDGRPGAVPPSPSQAKPVRRTAWRSTSALPGLPEGRDVELALAACSAPARSTRPTRARTGCGTAAPTAAGTADRRPRYPAPEPDQSDPAGALSRAGRAGSRTACSRRRRDDRQWAISAPQRAPGTATPARSMVAAGATSAEGPAGRASGPPTTPPLTSERMRTPLAIALEPGRSTRAPAANGDRARAAPGRAARGS